LDPIGLRLEAVHRLGQCGNGALNVGELSMKLFVWSGRVRIRLGRETQKELERRVGVKVLNGASEHSCMSDIHS
jgi:hypothetical protein